MSILMLILVTLAFLLTQSLSKTTLLRKKGNDSVCSHAVFETPPSCGTILRIKLLLLLVNNGSLSMSPKFFYFHWHVNCLVDKDTNMATDCGKLGPSTIKTFD